MVMESMNGKTIENTPATGSTANNTDWVYTQSKRKKESNTASGKMAKGLSGLVLRVSRKLTDLKSITHSITRVLRVSKVSPPIALFRSLITLRIE